MFCKHVLRTLVHVQARLCDVPALQWGKLCECAVRGRCHRRAKAAVRFCRMGVGVKSGATVRKALHGGSGKSFCAL